jgi:hypothetical protein
MLSEHPIVGPGIEANNLVIIAWTRDRSKVSRRDFELRDLQIDIGPESSSGCYPPRYSFFHALGDHSYLRRS